MVSEHIEDYQRLVDILLSHRGKKSKLILTHSLPIWLYQELHKCLTPVLSVTQQTKITKRLLGTPELPLFFAQFVREFDQKSPVAVTLVLRKSEDTSDVIIVRGLFLFREVPDDVASSGIPLALKVEVRVLNSPRMTELTIT